MSYARNTKVVREYLHGGDEGLSELWHHDAPQQDVFMRRLYEVVVDLEVDLDTGETRIIAVDGWTRTEDSVFS